MFWSIGVMSNLYPNSSVKLPCSAYSVSMDLALSVNFWDTGPEAIGEDMHMYLKCFFATQGRVIVKSIFSPASQCNVEGEGTGVSGWFDGIAARYNQAKRHLWGSLDTSYAVRCLIFSLLAPETQTRVLLKNSKVDKLGKSEIENGLQVGIIFALLHRLLEAHILMGHLFLIASITSLVLPYRDYLTLYDSFPLSLPWQSQYVLMIGFWMRTCCILPNVIMIYYYEKYHSWVSVERWNLSALSCMELTDSSTDSSISLESLNSLDRLNPLEDKPHLGKRSQLLYTRTSKKDMFDWFMIPIAGFAFYICPQFHAQICHLWTDTLDYKVAAKPQLPNRPLSIASEETLVCDTSSDDLLDMSLSFSSTPRLSSKGDEGFFEDLVLDSDVSLVSKTVVTF